jgi:hypothetical protein
MGKVLEKLQALPAVKTLVQGKNGISITLSDGYAQPDGSLEVVVQTAHAARLWIQSASNGRDTARRSRKVKTMQVMGEDGQVVEQEVEAVVPYPGIPKEDRKPIWEYPKGFNMTDIEARDAFRRGYAKNSHCAGATTYAKEFEQSWEAERRAAEARAAKEATEAVVESLPTVPDVTAEAA